MSESSRATEYHLDRERALVLDWLRASHRRSQFLVEKSPPELRRYHSTIAQHFLEYIQPVGFECQVIEIKKDGHPAYEVRWTHRGSSFVGFRQPPVEANSADALLAGCAALLENEWCRARLPE